MKKYLILFLKGMGMGVANVIPGVSGGTIALITEIYEDLINSLKSVDKQAIKYLISFKIEKFIQHTNFYFLAAVFSGSIASVFSVAILFKYLFANYNILIWAFFFGLILASVIFIGKRVSNWNVKSIIALIVGTITAFSLSLINPGTENSNLFFVFICGIIGVSGMLLPGLSGSYILILLGNYELLMVNAVTELNIMLLSIFFVGSVFGLMSFSHFLSWILKKYRDATLALLTGFILGSLKMIWPWKEIVKSIIINGNEKVLSYNTILPSDYGQNTQVSMLLMIIGFLIVYSLENYSKEKK
jgi:putative membrane protein